jgi:hypothetical protein
MSTILCPTSLIHCIKTINYRTWFDTKTWNSTKTQRFQCLRAEYVASVGNLSLQRYPDILFFSVIQFMAFQCRKVSVFLQTAFALYREAKIAIDLKTKLWWNGWCNASNVYVISRSSSRREIYRQRETRIIKRNFDHSIFRIFSTPMSTILCPTSPMHDRKQ